MDIKLCAKVLVFTCLCTSKFHASQPAEREPSFIEAQYPHLSAISAKLSLVLTKLDDLDSHVSRKLERLAHRFSRMEALLRELGDDGCARATLLRKNLQELKDAKERDFRILRLAESQLTAEQGHLNPQEDSSDVCALSVHESCDSGPSKKKPRLSLSPLLSLPPIADISAAFDPEAHTSAIQFCRPDDE